MLEEGKVEWDPLIDAPSDERYGITLLARPNQAVKENIQAFLSEIKSIMPEQYYYPDSDVHLTVMSIISCYEGFQLEQIEPEAYQAVINACLDGIHPFRIFFRGITASPSCILIQGFPENDALHLLRNRLRQEFQASSLEHSIDKRYAIQTAHSTVLRFRTPEVPHQSLTPLLKAYRHTDFGMTEVDQLELVFNDWFQRWEKVQLLSRFNLNAAKE